MNCIVIGAGASGLMAAITAADHCSVTLLERQTRVGRKLLATGNGRCNLSNRNAGLTHYHGQTPDFCLPALRGFSVEETLDWFRTRGLLTVTEADGRVYPYSDMANSVLDVLRFAADRPSLTLETGCEVRSISRGAEGFSVRSVDGRTFSGQRLIMAAGGLAGSKLGGSLAGYRLMARLGHACTPLRPSLVQLRTDDTFVRALKGVRAQCLAEICVSDTRVSERGEVQFTEYGVSGPVIFSLSRAAAEAGPDSEVRLDLLPDLTQEEVLSLLCRRREVFPALPAGDLLTGMLHNRLGRTLLRYAGLPADLPLSSLSDMQLAAAAAAAKCFVLPLLGPMEMDHAQVTAGGLKTEQFDPETLESRLVPGLYACGEVLDIDGDCGGYNLQWAWSSGRLAGQLRHREALL